ncbi:MAG: ComEA family DNA-binding protein [Granulosicoccus sp.]
MRYVFMPLVLLLFMVSPDITYANNSGSETSQSLDINAANAALLAERLPGIGPAKAALIVQWREQNGLFKDIEQLQEVKGIGPKTIEKLRPYIRVGSEAAARRTLMQHNRQEDKIRSDVQRLITAATVGALPESLQALPGKRWYRKSILEILRTH